MARVRIQPGGKIVIALIIVAAVVFVFFQLFASSRKKSVVTMPGQAQPAAGSGQVASVEKESQPIPVAREEKPAVTPEARPISRESGGSVNPIRVYFAFNRAGINKNVYCIFDRIQSIVGHTGTNGIRIEVAGNADSIGPPDYNVELSRRRALRVADSIANRLGIPMERISIVANGSSKPIASNRTSAGRADNRRTDVIIYR